MKLALFDLDNTLLSGDSDYEWAQFLIGKGVVDKAIQTAANDRFYADYKAGCLDINAFLDFQLAPLARTPRQTLDQWHHEFMQQHILPRIGKAARALVDDHRNAGHLCAIVTATNSFVTGPIAAAFGIPHLIATIPECDLITGQFTGRPNDTPAFKEGKITRVDAWLSAMGLWWGSFEQSWFYSDSRNDLPLMEKVSNPVAVKPDAALRNHAQCHGWPILEF
jgi:HAD superfamily hydrolase (TIGR01490 family)